VISRRTLIVGALASSLAPFIADAQQKSGVARVGLFGNTPEPQWEAFRKTLRDLGWVEGRNLVIDERWMMGDAQRAGDLAANLIDLNPDVLVASSSTQVEALRRLTKTIPIIFVLHADPVGVGHVASLARPGGNITGLSQLLTEVSAKMLQMLHEAVPRASRIGVLWNPTTPSHPQALKVIELAARQLSLRAVVVEAKSVEELAAAFATLTRERVEALLVIPSPLIFRERDRLAELCLAHRLPAMFGFRQNVEAGGLFSFGVDIRDQIARAAVYVDRVLRGAKPAELPVEQAMRFELAINMKTAKAIGLTIPAAVLLRADHVIE
jgi:putative tryptophan/tyrosine transport system substrate-binding protein